VAPSKRHGPRRAGAEGRPSTNNNDGGSLLEPSDTSQADFFAQPALPLDDGVLVFELRMPRRRPMGRAWSAMYAGWTSELAGLSDKAFRAFCRILDALTVQGSMTGILPGDLETLRAWMGARERSRTRSLLDEMLAHGCVGRAARTVHFVLREGGDGGGTAGRRSTDGGPSREDGRVTVLRRGGVVVPNWAKYQGYALQDTRVPLSLLSLSSSRASSDSRGEPAAPEPLDLDGGDADPVLRVPEGARLPAGFPAWPRSWYEARAAELAEAMGYADLERIPLAGGAMVEAVSSPGILVGWLARSWEHIHAYANRRARGRTPAYRQTATSWWQKTCAEIASRQPTERSWNELRTAMAWCRANLPREVVEAGIADFTALLRRRPEASA
jgi:hypothetical protein